ncbi:uncharacterized protein CC84DRAFT_1141132 [Paraphaeosphaeria sporulosa]|uniref:Ribonuclease H2 subunit B n=1 Tax=Paraphaeosphaeria sporulosa TaxID=1460663 RepID=A0A177CLK9_9PLEO|nr:uncharacterized protein CC84DRAFT_1141132 [Paraphaeosphaeria sporulosa]OAG08434.1 hypothetical protein CC84DRAFT_1141132 [Paraphaeosphaeria sporulosa]
MARTRSKPKAAATKETTPEPPQSTAKPLPPSTSNPPKVFVLPRHTSHESRIVTLNNPANGAPSRYYFCPSKGFYEFTRIAAPKKDCKSWLITPEKTSDNVAKEQEAQAETTTDNADTEAGLGGGYLTNKADMFLATPIDLLFLILPALAPKAGAKQGDKQYFLSFEDHLDNLASLSRQWKVLLSQHPSLKDRVEQRMAAVCDTVTAGDETMYRLSTDKLTRVLTRKAERMCTQGLPPSMEERFVKTALEVPVMNVLRSDTFTTTSALADSSATITVESHTTATSFTSTTDDLVAKPAIHTPPEVPHLLRLRTSLTYLSSSYLPPTLHPLITSSRTPDFSSLDTHLAALTKLRAEALALRSISDNISRKRGYDEDEGAAMEREEKKRKKEEEEKKKKSESRGVKQLKKVDTSGMKKLSSFFAKKAK